MASFPGKIGWKMLRNRENKNYRAVPTRRVTENSKKMAKKFKNTILASFQVKIGWKMMTKGENKNYHSLRSYPTRN